LFACTYDAFLALSKAGNLDLWTSPKLFDEHIPSEFCDTDVLQQDPILLIRRSKRREEDLMERRKRNGGQTDFLVVSKEERGRP